MEQLLRQHIESQLRKHPVASLDVVCRSTFCRIKATGKVMDSKEVFRKVAQEAAAEAWSDLSAGTSGGGSSGDGWHEEVTLNRRSPSR